MRVVVRHRREARHVRLHAATCRDRRVPRFAPGIYLAGDYVDAEFPATLEAAVRSGIAAAEALLADGA